MRGGAGHGGEKDRFASSQHDERRQDGPQPSSSRTQSAVAAKDTFQNTE